MGSLFSTPEPSSLEAAAASVVGEEAEDTLKGSRKSPTKRKRDGRSYAEVVRSGPETNAMSELQEPGPAWKFCEAPKDEKMFERECLP